MGMRCAYVLLLLPLLAGCTDRSRGQEAARTGSGSPTSDAPATERPYQCPGEVPVVEGPTITIPMRLIGQPGLPQVEVRRGHDFQGVLPPDAGEVTVTVEQDARAVTPLAGRSAQDGNKLLAYQAVDRGTVTVVATSTSDPASKYGMNITVVC